MKKFIARFAVVFLVAGLIVGVGFAAKQWQPVASFFSKDGRTEAEAGPNGARPGENKPAAPTASAAGAADPAASSEGNELDHPAEDKSDFERWPDFTDTSQLVHALQIMVPITIVVVGFDMLRRRSRNAKRLGATVRLRSAS